MLTILFDLDGTISDSSAGILKSVRLGLDYYNCDHYTDEQLRVFIGPPLRDMFPRFGVPADSVDRAIEVFREYYNVKGKYENTPYEGVEAMLKTLKADGYQLCIATSKPETTAKDVLNYFGLSKYFDLIAGATMSAQRESKEQVIDYLLKQYDGSSFVMIGDTHYDVIGAAAFNIQTIGVSWGFGTIEELVDAGAIAVAHTPEELVKLIRQFDTDDL